MYPICVTSIHKSQISLHFTLRPAVFDIQAILKKNAPNAPNDPQITLNAARSNLPHTCVTSINVSQISVCFSLQQTEIQAILRQVL